MGGKEGASSRGLREHGRGGVWKTGNRAAALGRVDTGWCGTSYVVPGTYWGQRTRKRVSVQDACNLCLVEGWLNKNQLVGGVSRWRRRSDHTDMRERQWRPQARHTKTGVGGPCGSRYICRRVWKESLELGASRETAWSDGREGRMWILYE